MKLRSLAIGLLFFCFTGFLHPVTAIYEPLSVPNNRFGIHLLSPDEIEKASQLVNSSGGDWGYVTIPIRSNDRDLETWTKFMNQAREKHLIPILRLASFQIEDRWDAPNEYSLIDFANFLDDLPWPVQNRYVIIYNEPNHKNEWGGFVYPEEYARILSRSADILHKKNPDFFIISAGLDSSAPNGLNSMNIYNYFQAMDSAIPGIFTQIDGMSFHAYGNPAFSTKPNLYSQVNINSFTKEAAFIKKQFNIEPKIFITEAGWRRDLVGDELTGEYYRFVLSHVWTDEAIAITPFVFNAPSGPFAGFSFLQPDGSYFKFAKAYQEFPKSKGEPKIALQQNKPSIVPEQAKSPPRRKLSSEITNLWHRFQVIVGGLLKF